VGSNTVHLLIVDAYYGAAPIPAHSQKIALRLSEHMKRGRIDDEASLALTNFVQQSLTVAEDMGAARIEAFATSAIREAENGPEVLRRVRDQTGVEIELLSGADEARLTFLAVRRWFGWSSGHLLVLDIGGGSLEIAVGSDEEPDVALSLPLGAGQLSRRHLNGDPPSEESIRKLRKLARAEVAGAVGQIRRTGDVRKAVASSKTFRQLARIAGAPPSGGGPFVRRGLLRKDLSAWLPKLSGMTVAERADLPGVSTGRASQLIAGALVAEAAMDLFEVDELEICPWALREGVILQRLDGLRQ
jgi:exopolyphosphatase/guanosine-5'-triphosphate,3'-diphosphate pyrophosphatase